MAKVYEALRRAEEERKRRAGDETSPAPPLDAPPVPAEPERRPIAKALSGRAQRRVQETAGEINKRRIAMLQPDSYVAEQFRALRGRIDALAAQRPIRTVAVSSPLAGEGKTTAAINLAAVTSMSVGRRVLLMDCDMRKPRIHQALGLRPETGLAEVLADQVPLDRAIIKIEGMNLDVLPVRGKPSNPSELLGSPRMRELIEEVAGRYDRVAGGAGRSGREGGSRAVRWDRHDRAGRPDVAAGRGGRPRDPGSAPLAGACLERSADEPGPLWLLELVRLGRGVLTTAW
ncbi:MAG: CpsD/CapB family tyrosine-protein kinase [Deltaproteobacteria bacterium]|nr:CpsD/CapB family tyrosine-protein kinase [Deltaproteobacteria bacterium]